MVDITHTYYNIIFIVTTFNICIIFHNITIYFPLDKHDILQKMGSSAAMKGGNWTSKIDYLDVDLNTSLQTDDRQEIERLMNCSENIKMISIFASPLQWSQNLLNGPLHHEFVIKQITGIGLWKTPPKQLSSKDQRNSTMFFSYKKEKKGNPTFIVESQVKGNCL